MFKYPRHTALQGYMIRSCTRILRMINKERRQDRPLYVPHKDMNLSEHVSRTAPLSGDYSSFLPTILFAFFFPQIHYDFGKQGMQTEYLLVNNLNLRTWVQHLITKARFIVSQKD